MVLHIKIAVYLIVTLCFFSNYCLFGQESNAQNTNYQNIKVAVFPLLPYALTRNDYYIAVQREKYLSKNSRFTSVFSLEYYNYFFRTYFGNQLIHSASSLSVTAKYNLRWYVIASEIPYNGLFVGLGPMYNWQILYDKTLTRNNFGMDAIVGYQRTFNRISLEINSSFGYTRGFYEFTYDHPYYGKEGLWNLTHFMVQLNLGYLFKSKRRKL